MKHIKLILIIFLTIASIFLTACDFEYESGDRFSYELQGTWFTNDYYNSKYFGSLEIGTNYIKINGYSENQTLFWEDDNLRPFKDFLKEWPVHGYSTENTKTSNGMDGFIFIMDAGAFPEEGIPYSYWTTTIYTPNYQRVHFLRFNFGGRNETLVKNTE